MESLLLNQHLKIMFEFIKDWMFNQIDILERVHFQKRVLIYKKSFYLILFL
jgi:hypothetical protein